MEGGGNGAMAQREHRLEQPRHSGSRFQVSHVGLHGADRQGVVRASPASEHPADRARLLRVAGGGSGAVGLDVGELARIHPRVRVRALEEPLLRIRVRHREPPGAPVRVDGRTEDQGVNGVAVPAGPGKALQEHHRAAFGTHVPVALGVERAAAAGRREHRGLGEADEAEGRHEDVDAAGERKRRFAPPDALAGLVQGDQGGRAGGIHRHARTMEIEDVGDAVGGDAERAAGHRVGVAGAGIVDAAVGVVGAGDADVDGAVASRQALGHLRAVFERLPGELQQEPLLRIHLRRLSGSDSEEGGIEAVDVVEHTGRPGVAAARSPWIGMVVVLGAEAPFVYLPDEVASLGEAVPECLRARCPAGKTAGHPHDCNGVFPLAQALKTPVPATGSLALP